MGIITVHHTHHVLMYQARFNARVTMDTLEMDWNAQVGNQ